MVANKCTIELRIEGEKSTIEHLRQKFGDPKNWFGTPEQNKKVIKTLLENGGKVDILGFELEN